MRFAAFCLLLLVALPAAAGPREAAAYSARFEGVAMVVMREGRIVFEDYPNGGSPDRQNRLASGTKSFSGAIAAAAVQDGLLTLDEKVSDTIAAWRADGRREITIRQLLSLTSGIETPPPLRELQASFDDAAARPLAHAPGSTFAYGQVPFQIFGALMERKLEARGETVTAYLRRRILDPLGIAVTWNRRGDPNLGGGASMTARDWARFGEFVRRGGDWNGVQLVDARALAGNFVPTAANPAYGLTWWLKPARGAALPDIPQLRRASDIGRYADDPDAPDRVWMAAGLGKQRLYIVPERGLVIVRQSGSLLRGENADFSDAAFLRLVLDGA